MEERANETTNLRVSGKKSYCWFLGPVSFLLHLLKGKMFFCKDKRLPPLLGWIFWKIPFNNCLIEAYTGLCKSHMGCGHEVYCMA